MQNLMEHLIAKAQNVVSSFITGDIHIIVIYSHMVDFIIVIHVILIMSLMYTYCIKGNIGRGNIGRFGK